MALERGPPARKTPAVPAKRTGERGELHLLALRLRALLQVVEWRWRGGGLLVVEARIASQPFQIEVVFVVDRASRLHGAVRHVDYPSPRRPPGRGLRRCSCAADHDPLDDTEIHRDRLDHGLDGDPLDRGFNLPQGALRDRPRSEAV